MKIWLIIFFLWVISSTLAAQDKKEFKRRFLEAEYFFLLEEYEEAAFLYQELLNSDPDNANLLFLCGASHLSYGNAEKAADFLERSVSSISPGYREGSYRERNAPKEALFALAKAYHMLNKFDPAVEYYQKFKNVMKLRDVARIEFVNKQFRSVELAESMLKDTAEVLYYPLFEDSAYFSNSYNAVFAPGDSTLIFLSDKPFYSSIMMTRFREGQWSRPEVINASLMLEGKIRLCYLSDDADELYLSKSEDFNSDIWVSYFKDGNWSNAVPLKEINTEYNETHACLNKTKDVLVFTSDRPGGYGALDLYMSKKTKNGTWGEAINMGKPLNSLYSEECPFLTENGKNLYFSSMGHPVMGGYDVFFSSKLPNGNWSYPANMGFPVSTTSDDLNFLPLNNGAQALYSGSKEFFRGAQVHLIEFPGDDKRPTFSLKGKITTGDNAFLSEETEVNIIERNSRDTIQRLKPDPETGEYIISIPKGEYEINIGAPGYDPESTSVVVNNEHNLKEIIIENKLLPVMSDSEVYILARNVLFEFDSEELSDIAKFELEKLYDVMSDHPDLLIELTGHTDSKGSHEYNMKLANRRTQSVLNYLVSRGVSASRFISKAVGEDQNMAINRFPDGRDSPEGRRYNRQVEIKLVKGKPAENILFKENLVPDHLRPEADKKYYVILGESPDSINSLIPDTTSEEIKMYKAENIFIFATGEFDNKLDAMKYLNRMVDTEFPDSRVVTETDFKHFLEPSFYSNSHWTGPLTVQILALQNPVSLDYFSDYDKILMIRGSDNIYRYITGVFKSNSEAEEKLSEYVLKGFNDTFIVPVSRFSNPVLKAGYSVPGPDYFFTIQFTAKHLKADLSDFADFTPLVISKSKDGLIHYSYGIYLEKGEAEPLLDFIRKNGFEDAFIRKIH